MRLSGNFLRDDEQTVLDIQRTIDEFYKSEEKIFRRRKFLTHKISYIGQAVKSYMLINGILFHVPIATSIIMSIIFKDFILLAPIFMPFIDPYSIYGFIVNEILMLLFSTMFYMLLIAYDLTCFYYILQVIPMCDVYIMNVKELGDKVAKQTENPYFMSSNVRKLIADFEKFSSYIQLVVNFMHLTTFAAMTINAVAIALSLFIALKLLIPIGISFGCICMFQVLLPCLQGTIISHQNQKILHAVWDFPWFQMKNKEQKLWLQFMHNCQHGSEFNILFIGQLNMECFAGVGNAAYSSLMFVLKLMK